MRKAYNNFAGGEWSPFLDGRADLQKYDSACRTLENMRPLPWGGATFRPGTEFLGLARYADRPCRLIPFNYSTALSYVIELGDLYMRFWYSNGAPVETSPGAPLTLTSPYAVGQIFAVQYEQINAQMRMVHPAVAPQTITYTSALSWAMAATAFRYPVLRDQNSTQSSTLALGATTGNTTLTASVAGTFNAGHVGSYWEIQHLRESLSVGMDMDNSTIGVEVYSNVIPIEGDWSFTTSQFWYGVVRVQRSIDGGSTWLTIREFTGKSDQNFATSGTESPPQIGLPWVYYRIAYTQTGAPFAGAVWTGAVPSQYAFAQASLVSQDAYIAGLVVVTGYTDSTHVNVTVVIAAHSTAATYLWSEGAFSTYRGFPQAIAFYEQRLLYSGTTSQPNTVWGSVTGDFDNFQYGDNDDAAVAFQPAVCQQNQTAWLATLLRVHVGTSGEEIIMASGNQDEALTPANITMRAQSFYGSTALQPLLLNNSIIFVERNGMRVREMRELSPYVVPSDFVAPDLTLMAEHVMNPACVSMDFGKLPDPLAYFVRSDGVMPVMTYNREQNINAWARYTTAGRFESVACIYGSPEDEVWVSCSRSLGSLGTVRTIEAFTTDPAVSPSLTANLLLDCGAQYTNSGAPAASVSGLTWLKGATVTAVIDGAEYPGLAVDGSGVLAFPANVFWVTSLSVGLPYVGTITTMKPEVEDPEGMSQGRKRRVTEVIVRVRSSVTMSYAGGTNPTVFKEMQFRSPGDAVGAMTPLSTTNQDGTANPDGITDWPLPGPWPDGNNYSGQVTLRQAHPFPLTVLGLFVHFEVS